jgi:pimeloyl-ACP methyl ester carboxylesterase
MTEATTHTLDVPGAVLTNDVHLGDSTSEPPLLLIGSPMAASGFVTLAGQFPDRTVARYDPRGSERSQRTDGATENTPEEHGGDLHRLISTLGTGLVDLFATSGGAVNALALVAEHQEDVRILVDHQPPQWQILPDREAGLATAVDNHETYLRSGLGAAMAKFIALAATRGRCPPITAHVQLLTRRCSACRRRMTAPATTRWSGRT